MEILELEITCITYGTVEAAAVERTKNKILQDLAIYGFEKSFNFFSSKEKLYHTHILAGMHVPRER